MHSTITKELNLFIFIAYNAIFSHSIGGGGRGVGKYLIYDLIVHVQRNVTRLNIELCTVNEVRDTGIVMCLSFEALKF